MRHERSETIRNVFLHSGEGVFVVDAVGGANVGMSLKSRDAPCKPRKANHACRLTRSTTCVTSK